MIYTNNDEEDYTQAAYYFVMTSYSSLCIISCYIVGFHNYHSKQRGQRNCQNVLALPKNTKSADRLLI